MEQAHLRCRRMKMRECSRPAPVNSARLWMSNHRASWQGEEAPAKPIRQWCCHDKRRNLLACHSHSDAKRGDCSVSVTRRAI